MQGEDKEKVKKREAAEREEKSRKVSVDPQRVAYVIQLESHLSVCLGVVGGICLIVDDYIYMYLYCELTGMTNAIVQPVSINEFLKPAEGEKYYGPPSSRGRGGRGGRGERGDRDRGDRSERGERAERGSYGGGFGGRYGGGRGGAGGGGSAPKIEDTMQFPTLGGK